MEKKSFVVIEGVRVDTSILKSYFVCDLNACKGACCTVKSEVGAPLRAEEGAAIKKSLPHALPLLSEASRKQIENKGHIKVHKGKLYTPTLDKKACVFAFFRSGFAYCSLEKAYQEGKTDFYKPLSCHLYPVRIKKYEENGQKKDWLYYQEHPVCGAACTHGKAMKMPLYKFLEEALCRQYGERWFAVLESHAEA